MRRFAIPVIIGFAAAMAACGGDEQEQNQQMQPEEAAPAAQEQAAPAEGERPEAAQEAMDHARDAASVVGQMQSDSDLGSLIDQARGIFIVPEYGRGAAVVGASGGQGILVARENGQWSDPVFYNIGSISVGPQFGGSGGSIAMLLMSDEAVNSFEGENTFSLDASAGLTIADYSTRAEAEAGTADVIMWSDTEGAFAGASLGGSEINFDADENRAYYGQEVTAQQILSGEVSSPQANPIQQDLSGAESQSQGQEPEQPQQPQQQ